MAINQAQVTQAQSVVAKLENTLQQLTIFIAQVESLMANNWIPTVNIVGIQATTPLSASDQTLILNQYITLKASLAALYAQLP